MFIGSDRLDFYTNGTGGGTNHNFQLGQVTDSSLCWFRNSRESAVDFFNFRLVPWVTADYLECKSRVARNNCENYFWLLLWIWMLLLIGDGLYLISLFSIFFSSRWTLSSKRTSSSNIPVLIKNSLRYTTRLCCCVILCDFQLFPPKYPHNLEVTDTPHI